MARNNTDNVLKFLALGALTVGCGGAIGYFVFGGTHPSQPSADATGIQQPAVPSGPAPMPTSKPRKAASARINSNYTAPGAPRIHIVEDKTPVLSDSASASRPDRRDGDTTDVTDIPTPDVEASQEGSGPPGPSASGTDSSATPSAPSPSPADTESNQTGDTGAASPPAPPADKDYEHIGGTTSTDTESSQTGDTSTSGKTGRRAQYRVQAGSFADAGNARDYVNSLHDRGYDADLHSERRGDRTVYRVQVGAYRNRSDADQAAADLRSNGVPVTVSPINP